MYFYSFKIQEIKIFKPSQIMIIPRACPFREKLKKIGITLIVTFLLFANAFSQNININGTITAN